MPSYLGGTMPYLSHPPIQLLIRSLPVAEHSVEVQAEFWLPFCAAGPQQAAHEAIFAGQPLVRISREWLRSEAGLPPEVRAAGTLFWGYPRGGRGDLHRQWLADLPQIAAAADVRGLAWADYYAQLHAIGGLGISTISKLACFFSQTFEDFPALILDQRILRVLASGRWHELAALQDMSYPQAPARYPDYLASLHGISIAGGFSAEQLEFFLFALGESF